MQYSSVVYRLFWSWHWVLLKLYYHHCIVLYIFSMTDDMFSVSQWTISELACYTYSLVAVPLYDTLGTEAIGYVIDKGNTEGHLRNTNHTPATLSYRSSFLDQGRRQQTQAEWIIRCRLFFSRHLHGDLWHTRKGSDDSGLCQRKRANDKDDCAHRSVWRWTGGPSKGVRRWDSEFEGVWGENDILWLCSGKWSVAPVVAFRVTLFSSVIKPEAVFLCIISPSCRHTISHYMFCIFSRPWVKPTSRNQW